MAEIATIDAELVSIAGTIDRYLTAFENGTLIEQKLRRPLRPCRPAGPGRGRWVPGR